MVSPCLKFVLTGPGASLRSAPAYYRPSLSLKTTYRNRAKWLAAPGSKTLAIARSLAIARASIRTQRQPLCLLSGINL